MPFEPTPQTTTNPWVEAHPKEAQALRDLAAYVRTVPNKLWRYEAIRTNGENHPCKTVGCALGHAPFVPSCNAIGIMGDGCSVYSQSPDGEPESAFRLPFGVADAFFYSGYNTLHVTQKMVADRIDHWLATGEIK